jgi:hypothetical protein
MSALIMRYAQAAGQVYMHLLKISLMRQSDIGHALSKEHMLLDMHFTHLISEFFNE